MELTLKSTPEKYKNRHSQKTPRLPPHHRQAIWLAYTQEKESVTSLARRYQVSRVTIYRALKAARGRLLKPQTSTNNRFKQAKYGMKRLAKVERSIQEKLKKLVQIQEKLMKKILILMMTIYLI